MNRGSHVIISDNFSTYLETSLMKSKDLSSPDVYILVEFRKERSLDGRCALPSRTGVDDPINNLVTILLVDEHCGNSNTLARSVIGHCNFRNVGLFLVIDDDDHGAAVPLNVACNLNEIAFFGVVPYQKYESLLRAVVGIIFIL